LTLDAQGGALPADVEARGRCAGHDKARWGRSARILHCKHLSTPLVSVLILACHARHRRDAVPSRHVCMHVCARCEHGTSGDVWHCASEAPPSQFRAPCAAQEEMQGTARRRRFGVGVLRPLRPVGQGAGGRVWEGKEGACVRTERMPAGMRTACT